jgi:hypothetical protein
MRLSHLIIGETTLRQKPRSGGEWGQYEILQSFTIHDGGLIFHLCRFSDATRGGLRPDGKWEDWEEMRILMSHGEEGIGGRAIPLWNLPVFMVHVPSEEAEDLFNGFRDGSIPWGKIGMHSVDLHVAEP